MLIDEADEIEAEEKADRHAKRIGRKREILIGERGEESSLRTDASLTLDSDSLDLEEMEDRGYFKPEKNPEPTRNVKYLYRQLLH